MAWGRRYGYNNKQSRYYSNENLIWALICFIASAVVCTFPWMSLEILGETFGGISLYTIASRLESIKALFNSFKLFGVSDFTLAYISVGLTIIALIAGLIVVIFWKRLGGLSWICGLFNIAAAGAWVLFMQNLPLYAGTALGGYGIGIGCWAFLVIGIAWIYIGIKA